MDQRPQCSPPCQAPHAHPSPPLLPVSLGQELAPGSGWAAKGSSLTPQGLAWQGAPLRRAQVGGGSAWSPKDTTAPHTPGKRHPKGSGAAAASPQALPAPGCGAPPSLAGGFPRAPVPWPPPRLCDGQHHPACPCGRMSILTALRQPAPLTSLATHGRGPLPAKAKAGQAGSRGSQAGGGPSRPAALASSSRRTELAHSAPAPLGLSPSPFAGGGLSRPPAELRFPAQAGCPPVIPRPRCSGGTWA